MQHISDQRLQISQQIFADAFILLQGLNEPSKKLLTVYSSS